MLASLPLARWALRFREGEVCLQGALARPLELALGEGLLRVPVGPLRLGLSFHGGQRPEVVGLWAVRGGLDWRAPGRALGGGRLSCDRETLALDGQALPFKAPGTLAETLVGHLEDVSLEASAWPEADLLLQLGHGVEVVIGRQTPLTIRGATCGPAANLQLCAPVVVGFGREGLRLSHHRFRVLSRLASVRVVRATLHPDGSVDLEGAGAPGVDLAVRGGLQRAGDRLSEMVRHSPQLARVRAFLRQP